MFIDILLELVKERGITKNKLLQDLNLSKNSFVNWEQRGTIPSGETLSKLADYFNTSVEYLLGKTEQKEKPTVNDGERDALERDIMELLDSLSPEKRERAIDYLKYLSNSK